MFHPVSTNLLSAPWYMPQPVGEEEGKIDGAIEERGAEATIDDWGAPNDNVDDGDDWGEPNAPIPQQLTPQLLLDQELVLSQPQDQQDFLSTVNNEELQAIKACYHDPNIPQLAAWIKSGAWLNLIDFVRLQPEEFPIYLLLKAAYCQGFLGEKDPSTEGIDNLATAYFFLAPLKAGQKFRLIHFDDVQTPPNNWEDEIDNRWEIEQIPENLRWFILVDTYLSQRTLSLTHAFFENPEAGKRPVAGAIHRYFNWGDNKTTLGVVGVGSAALLRKDTLLENHPPIFGRGFRSVSDRFTNLLKGGFDVALFEPSEKVLIHGVPNEGNLGALHDAFHGTAAVTNKVYNHPEVLRIGLKVDSLVREKMPPYSANVNIMIHNYWDYLEGPDLKENDWMRFLLYKTLINIQDGEGATLFADKLKGGPKEIFVKSIEKEWRRQITKHPARPLYWLTLAPLARLINQWLEPFDIKCRIGGEKTGCGHLKIVRDP